MAAKPFVALPVVGADPDNIGPVPSYGFVCVTEAPGLTVSACGEVLYVEIKDYGSVAAPFGKGKPSPIVLHSLEIRRPNPYL